MSAPPRGSRAGQDRWLLSYADLVTLLFAFFTVLYASSTLDTGRAGAVSASLKDAFDAGSTSAGPKKTPVVAPVQVVPSSLDPSPLDTVQRRLEQELADAIRDRRIEMTRDARGLVLSLPEQATFAVGSAELTAAAAALLIQVTDPLRDARQFIRVEGHTDDTPIHTSQYGSNWELSTARASAVIALLIDRVGLEPSRLSAAGYGEFHPRVPNTSPAARARNRRIDLVILAGSDR